MNSNKKILYVDDEYVNLELFKINFEFDFEVFIADSARKGLEILHDSKDIDVIISDLKMPEMDGIEFIEKIKQEDPNKICILLTAFVESDVMLKAINEELIFRYVIKPWNKDDLKDIIEKAFYKFNEV